LLASPTTIQTRLYENPLVKAGVRVILPTVNEQAAVETAIRNVISGNSNERLLRPIIARLQSMGAEKVLLGCTELSVLFEHQQTADLLDPLDIVTTKLLPKC
jgi:aspartate racemase